MSGTQDENLSAQNSAGEFETGQSGIGKNEKNGEESLSPAQKMDLLLRGSNPQTMKKEIEKLRKESAKYRTASKTVSVQNQELQTRADEIQKEFESLKSQHRNLNLIQQLDRAGCVKSELVAKDIPADCEDLETFIESYKEENAFLFKAQKQSHGGAFKPSGAKNLTPSQQMDAYIRKALGR